MKTCVFAGTFDPITKGHEWVINKCLEAFDKVIVAVGVNIDKSPMFSCPERVEIIRGVFGENQRIEVATYDGMLVEFMKERGIKFNVRGLRDADDYKYETTMARYNFDMYPDIVTIFIPTPTELTYVSSSAIRNIIGLNSDFSQYVPEPGVKIIKTLLKKR